MWSLLSVGTQESLVRVASFFVLVVLFQVSIAQFHLQREAKRRWQHAITGQALVLISYYLPIEICIAALVVGATGIWYLRIYQTDTFIKTFGALLRPSELDHEQRRMPGAFYFLVGTALTAFLFPIETARYAVQCLSFADPMAAWIGQAIPSPKWHDSASLAGCLACFVTAVVMGVVFLPPPASSSSTPPEEWSLHALQIVTGALGCTLMEALPYGHDNLLIPVGTAAAVHVFR